MTRFEFRLHPIGPTVLGGMLLYPAAMAAAVQRNFRDVMADAADEVGAGVALLTAPPEESIPEPLRGQPVVGVIVCYAGPVEEGERALRPLSGIVTFPGGGACARVPDGTMAIGQRDAPSNIHITSLWPDPADDEANIAWTRELSAAMKPFTTGRVYVNLIGDEGEDRVVAAFGPEGYARLQAIKDHYDPGNLFCKPTGTG